MKSEIEALIFIPRFCFNDRRIALFSVILVKNGGTQKKTAGKIPAVSFVLFQTDLNGKCCLGGN